MINIQNAQIVTYSGGEKNITVYFDFDEKVKKYYIVPIPHIVKATDADVPVFSLTRYKSNKGGITGVCTFDVELQVPADALKAVKDALAAQGKGDYVQGQLEWVSVNTFFRYVLQGKEQIINMVPSMYGQNRASFVVPLAKDEDVTTFINAFHSGGGSVSPFSIQYDMTSLTKLVGVKASVSYDASIAIEWQRTYVTQKDTWGRSKSVLAEVKKNLKQSGAGKVVIDPMGPISDETRQRVQDWAWTSLETMVADAVDIANAAATSEFPVQSTASFTQNYQENEVIEWAINSGDNLPMFDNATWGKVFHEVDLRQLVVNFSLTGDFGSDPKNGVEKAEITVKYPGTEPQTFNLFPTTNQSTFTYRAPGNFVGGEFNPLYTYRFKVYYKNQAFAPYESEDIPWEETIVDIRPTDFGIQKITFVGSNIPFTLEKTGSSNAITVDRLLIDFYFNRPKGVENKTEQKEMKTNTGEVVFESYFAAPIENTYVYRLTYIMSDRTQMIVNPTREFGSDNSNKVLIAFPLQEITFSINASKNGTEELEVVLMDALYIDEQNKGLEPSMAFDPWTPNLANKFAVNPQKWKFLAKKNPDGAHYKFNGTLLFSDHEIEMNDYRLQATKSSLTIFTDKEQSYVAIDWNGIDWNTVSNVEITLFQYEGTVPQNRVEHILHPSSIDLLTDPKETNKQNYPLLATQDVIKPRLIYNVLRGKNDPRFDFWMGVVYNQKDGHKRYLSKKQLSTSLFTLPPNGDSTTIDLSLVSLEIKSEDLPMRKKHGKKHGKHKLSKSGH